MVKLVHGWIVLIIKWSVIFLNRLNLWQNNHHFTDIFEYIFLNENVAILIKISLKFVPRDPINNDPALVQIMAWCLINAKPLSESKMA